MMKKGFLLTVVFLLAFGAKLSIAQTATATVTVLPKKIDLRQALCLGRLGETSEGYVVYDNPVAQYHSRSILNYWFPLAIQQAEKDGNKNTIHVPSQVFVSPDGKRLALLTANYRNLGKKLAFFTKRGGHSLKFPEIQDFCKTSQNFASYMPDADQTSIFIVSNGRIKQFSNDAIQTANFAAMWLITGWSDNRHLQLQAVPYDLGAGGSSAVTRFAVLNTESGKQTEIQYVRGVPYRQWYILTADPFLLGKQDNRLGAYGSDSDPDNLNFYLFNAKTGKCALIHTVDASKQAVTDLRVSTLPGGASNTCTSVSGDAIIKTINTVYTNKYIKFLVPSIADIKQSREGILIKYRYQLNETSPLYSSTLSVTNRVINQLANRIK